MQQEQWRKLNKPDLVVAHSISEAIGRGVDLHASVLRSLRRSDRLFAFSDVGGDHRRARHRAYAFLVVAGESVQRWLHLWQPMRRRLLPDNRRMSYERLRDRSRRDAADAFLEVSDQLSGFLVTLMVEKTLRLFETDVIPDEFARWKRKPFERLLLATHLLSVLIAGITSPDQDVLWISDDDDLAPNESRLWDVCDVVTRISAQYLAHNLGHFRFATARSDDGSRQIEDLLALPDFAAGWLPELLRAYQDAGAELSENVVTPPPDSLPAKTRHLLTWAARPSRGLQQVAVAVEPNVPSSAFLVRTLHFSLH